MGTSPEHKATFRAGPSGTWQGGCHACGVGFSGETSKAAAAAWCDGHNQAVARARHVAATNPPFFASTGPGAALKLVDLIARAVEADDWLMRQGHARTEVLQPADQVPLLYLWTPPSEDGWQRERLGVIYIEGSGEFVAERRSA